VAGGEEPDPAREGEHCRTWTAGSTFFVWTKYRPIEFAEFLASEDARREAWRRKFALEATLTRAAPNRGHRAVAELVRRGLVAVVITQNIDGLHQASGVPESSVVELHGNTTYARCLGCGRRYELDEIRAAFAREERSPSCASCGGHVKTATISFGQPMPALANPPSAPTLPVPKTYRSEEA
jgi:NAD-dependent deacetylase